MLLKHLNFGNGLSFVYCPFIHVHVNIHIHVHVQVLAVGKRYFIIYMQYTVPNLCRLQSCSDG
jgi:hypothetical protein